MNIFLRAKHWQLFLLTFGIPLLLEIVMMFLIFSNLLKHPNTVHDFETTFAYFKLFPLIMLLFMGTLLGWQWSVAVGLQKMTPPTVKMNVRLFKVFLLIPAIYILLVLVFISYIFTLNFSNSEIIDQGFYIFIPFLIIFPLHLFAMFCLFYCIYFVAKTLKTVELQREVVFSDFMAESFLTWFFPVGVWILQPRINRIIAQPEVDAAVPASQDDSSA